MILGCIVSHVSSVAQGMATLVCQFGQDRNRSTDTGLSGAKFEVEPVLSALSQQLLDEIWYRYSRPPQDELLQLW